jgi:hypothetical protein
MPQNTQTDLDSLLELASQLTFNLSPASQAFALVPVGAGSQAVPVGGPALRAWLISAFLQEFGRPPSQAAWREALRVLDAIANTRPNFHAPVFRRLAYQPAAEFATEMIGVSLFDPALHAPEITAEGWTLNPASGFNVAFSAGDLALPMPDSAADPAQTLSALRALLRPAGGADWLRLLAWLMSCLYPGGDYPVLHIRGPAGSGRSTAARLLRSILDPKVARLLRLPDSPRMLFELARHNSILAFDQVTAVSPAPLNAAARGPIEDIERNFTTASCGARIRPAMGGPPPVQR